jgi:hypothetical protein
VLVGPQYELASALPETPESLAAATLKEIAPAALLPAAGGFGR